MDLALRQRVFLGVRDQGDAFGGGFDKVIGTGNLRGKEYGV
jgi:hypothetical protein